MDDEGVIDALSSVKGIGRWTAEMYLMFRLGRPDVLPVDDYGIRKAMQRAYRKRALPKPDWMRRAAEPWRPYRSVACWYLWRSLES
jgi:3-methyladenine DNA glycosylase/8-oxoguanine DNA glycosylase